MQIPRKMSAQNVMASISRSLGNRQDSKPADNEVKLAGEESKDKFYEPKHNQKLFRVLTVIAYIISVSLAAIILSLYYTYIWDPADNPHISSKQKSESNTANKPCVLPSSIKLPDNEVSSENTTPVIPVSLLPETPDSSLSKTGLKERNLWSILTEPVEAKSTPPTIKDKSSSTVPSDPYPMVKQTFDDYQVPGNIETD